MAKVKKRKKPSKEFNSSPSLFNELTRLRFELNDKMYEIDYGEEININSEEDASRQLEKLPAVIAYTQAIFVKLDTEHELKKLAFKKVESKIDKLIRDSGFTGEQRIDRKVKRHPAWVKASSEVILARAQVLKARGFLQSLLHKLNVLLNRGADVRSNPSDSVIGYKCSEILSVDSIASEEEMEGGGEEE